MLAVVINAALSASALLAVPTAGSVVLTRVAPRAGSPSSFADVRRRSKSHFSQREKRRHASDGGAYRAAAIGMTHALHIGDHDSGQPDTAALDSQDQWHERETWALEDSVQLFAVNGGQRVLWRRLVLEVPELLHRSPTELRERWLQIQADRGESDDTLAWEDVPCLEGWRSVGPSRYQGDLHGHRGVRDGSLCVTIEHDVESAAEAPPNGLVDMFAEQWCVLTRSGELYQLGAPYDLTALQSGLAMEGSSLAPLSGIGEVDSATRAAIGTVGGLVGPTVLTAGVLLAASAIGYMVLGHHHIDVSVFVV